MSCLATLLALTRSQQRFTGFVLVMLRFCQENNIMHKMLRVALGFVLCHAALSRLGAPLWTEFPHGIARKEAKAAIEASMQMLARARKATTRVLAQSHAQLAPRSEKSHRTLG
eukprot:4388160-Amphidinium_carterae.1